MESYSQFTRNVEVGQQLRPHNPSLSNVLVDSVDIDPNNINAYDRSIRPNNNAVQGEMKRWYWSDTGREPNANVESSIYGGSLAREMRLHPRLARDPTWYPGRGREKAKGILKQVGNVAMAVAPALLL